MAAKHSIDIRKHRVLDTLTGLLILSIVIIISSPAIAKQSLVDDRRSSVSSLSTLVTDTILSPGTTVGVTSYDLQHIHAQGHQIATNAGSDVVHFVWTGWDDLPDSISGAERFVRYNYYDKNTGQLGLGFNGLIVSQSYFSRGAFIRADVSSVNSCQSVLHQLAEPERATSHAYLIDLTAVYPTLSGLQIDHQLESGSSSAGNLWPDVAIEQNPPYDGLNDIRHVVASGQDHVGELPNPTDRLYYWRYDNSTAGPWQGPVLIDSTGGVLGYTIDAADNLRRVAIAYHSDYSTDSLNSVNNVAYRESYTSGIGWLTGIELGELNKNLITDYSDSDGPSAGMETSIAYDHSGTLHIIFTELRQPNPPDIAVKHWNSVRQTAETVTGGYYSNNGTWYFSENLSQISLGVGDGATLCNGTDNTDYLYVMYTKLCGETLAEQSDTSKQGLCNGELYLTASNDGGTRWSDPINLTNTKTPNCDSDNPDSVCASEAWGTLARDVSDIDILYIRDYEAGYFGESGWTMNKVMYLNIPGGTSDDPFFCPDIPCRCYIGDPNRDGANNVLDVVYAVNVAFRSRAPFTDPYCPVELTDVNCDGVTNVLDVVLIVNAAFRGAPPEVFFCHPCAL
jgi:hypothetical protein